MSFIRTMVNQLELEKPSDYFQREQAIDPTRSFIVQAPAGSGKTELLTQRYLTLLTTVKNPEEIVAITFTRKAAGEMRSRILKELLLQRTETAKVVLARDAQLSWKLLENPNRLRIHTIDALCGHISKQIPLLSRSGIETNILEDPDKVYREAADAVLTSLEQEFPWTEDLAKFLLHLDNDYSQAETLLADMLRKRDQWLPYIYFANNHDLSLLRVQLEKSLQQVSIDTISKLQQFLTKDLWIELLEIANFAAQSLKKYHSESLITFCSDLQVYEDYFTTLTQLNAHDLEIQKNAWVGIAKLLLKEDDEWRKQVSKREGFISQKDAQDELEKKLTREMKLRAETLLSHMATNEGLRKLLVHIKILPPCSYSSTQWDILISLLKILPVTVAQLQVCFQEHQAVDYIEIAQNALLALGELDKPSELAMRLDYQIQHLLVDEFQDTSISQFRLLEHLTAGWQNDGRTLFLVGDPMQSIYRFRKAEVGLFLKAQQQGIGDIRLESLQLKVNFRSEPAIIQWFNDIFTKLMPDRIDLGSGAVPFSASMSAKVESNGGKIYTQAVIENQECYEGQLISQIIKKTFAENPKNRIAILVKARSHLTNILPILSANKISYQAVEIETLAHRPVIQDLLALTRALLHPADRIAWLAILRAPWCGLTLQELTQIFGNNFSTTVWDQLLNYPLESLIQPAKKNLQKMIKVLKLSLRQRRRQALSEWVYGTWLALGGPLGVKNKLELEDVDLFLKLLDRLAIANDLENTLQLEQQLEKLYASSAVKNEQYVEVMTIHKAKGLEFDTVILPSLESTFRADSPDLLLYMERINNLNDTDLLLAPVKAREAKSDVLYNYLRSEEKERAKNEIIRLLYVAITRAKNSLYLLSTLDPEWIKKTKAPPSNTLLGYLWPCLQESFVQNVIPKENFIPAEIKNNNNLLRRPSIDWHLPHLNNEEVIFDEIDDSYASNNQNFFWFEHEIRPVGITVHRLLHQISIDGLEKWPSNNLANRQQVFSNLLLRLGVDPLKISTSTSKVMLALENTLNDAKGRWILTSHKEAQSEFQLTAHVDNEIKQIIIDRTFIDENNVRWIIDYKTVQIHYSKLEYFLDQQMLQHRQQLELYAKIMRGFDPHHPIKLGLYFPLQKAWKEWSFSHE